MQFASSTRSTTGLSAEVILIPALAAVRQLVESYKIQPAIVLDLNNVLVEQAAIIADQEVGAKLDRKVGFKGIIRKILFSVNETNNRFQAETLALKDLKAKAEAEGIPERLHSELAKDLNHASKQGFFSNADSLFTIERDKKLESSVKDFLLAEHARKSLDPTSITENFQRHFNARLSACSSSQLNQIVCDLADQIKDLNRNQAAVLIENNLTIQRAKIKSVTGVEQSKNLYLKLARSLVATKEIQAAESQRVLANSENLTLREKFILNIKVGCTEAGITGALAGTFAVMCIKGAISFGFNHSFTQVAGLSGVILGAAHTYFKTKGNFKTERQNRQARRAANIATREDKSKANERLAKFDFILGKSSELLNAIQTDDQTLAANAAVEVQARLIMGEELGISLIEYSSPAQMFQEKLNLIKALAICKQQADSDFDAKVDQYILDYKKDYLSQHGKSTSLLDLNAASDSMIDQEAKKAAVKAALIGGVLLGGVLAFKAGAFDSAIHSASEKIQGFLAGFIRVVNHSSGKSVKLDSAPMHADSLVASGFRPSTGAEADMLGIQEPTNFAGNFVGSQVSGDSLNSASTVDTCSLSLENTVATPIIFNAPPAPDSSTTLSVVGGSNTSTTTVLSETTSTLNTSSDSLGTPNANSTVLSESTTESDPSVKLFDTPSTDTSSTAGSSSADLASSTESSSVKTTTNSGVTLYTGRLADAQDFRGVRSEIHFDQANGYVSNADKFIDAINSLNPEAGSVKAVVCVSVKGQAEHLVIDLPSDGKPVLPQELYENGRLRAGVRVSLAYQTLEEDNVTKVYAWKTDIGKAKSSAAAIDLASLASVGFASTVKRVVPTDITAHLKLSELASLSEGERELKKQAIGALYEKSGANENHEVFKVITQLRDGPSIRVPATAEFDDLRTQLDDPQMSSALGITSSHEVSAEAGRGTYSQIAINYINDYYSPRGITNVSHTYNPQTFLLEVNGPLDPFLENALANKGLGITVEKIYEDGVATSDITVAANQVFDNPGYLQTLSDSGCRYRALENVEIDLTRSGTKVSVSAGGYGYPIKPDDSGNVVINVANGAKVAGGKVFVALGTASESDLSGMPPKVIELSPTIHGNTASVVIPKDLATVMYDEEGNLRSSVRVIYGTVEEDGSTPQIVGCPGGVDKRLGTLSNEDITLSIPKPCTSYAVDFSKFPGYTEYARSEKLWPLPGGIDDFTDYFGYSIHNESQRSVEGFLGDGSFAGLLQLKPVPTEFSNVLSAGGTTGINAINGDLVISVSEAGTINTNGSGMFFVLTSKALPNVMINETAATASISIPVQVHDGVGYAVIPKSIKGLFYYSRPGDNNSFFLRPEVDCIFGTSDFEADPANPQKLKGIWEIKRDAGQAYPEEMFQTARTAVRSVRQSAPAPLAVERLVAETKPKILASLLHGEPVFKGKVGYSFRSIAPSLNRDGVGALVYQMTDEGNVLKRARLHGDQATREIMFSSYSKGVGGFSEVPKKFKFNIFGGKNEN